MEDLKFNKLHEIISEIETEKENKIPNDKNRKYKI